MIREQGLSIEEFVSLESKDCDRFELPSHARQELSFMLENGQAKFISGLDSPLGESGPELYQLALRNMDERLPLLD